MRKQSCLRSSLQEQVYALVAHGVGVRAKSKVGLGTVGRER